MRQAGWWLACGLAALCGMAGAGTTCAAEGDGRVELTIVGASQVHGEFHDWAQLLNRVGAARVQFRGAQSGDQVGIEVQGSADRPTYAVLGMLSGNELVLPGGRFRRGDEARLRSWVQDVAENGPPDRRPARSPFGLSAKQYQEVREDLAQPVHVTTMGLRRNALVEQLAGGLKWPLRLDAATLRGIGDDPLADELTGLARGTALAAALRPAGFCLVPKRVQGSVSYTIGPAQGGIEIWPVGQKPERPPREVLPGLFEFLTVNIQGVPASKAMQAIARRLNVPLLLDHNALARFGIDPDQVLVKVPQGRTSHSLVLQRVLSQAKLKYEVRTDEAGKPFLWITTIRPLTGEAP